MQEVSNILDNLNAKFALGSAQCEIAGLKAQIACMNQIIELQNIEIRELMRSHTNFILSL